LSDLNREGTPLLSNLVDRDAFFRDYEAATGFTIDEDCMQRDVATTSASRARRGRCRLCWSALRDLGY
jgi:hypothetical protein